MRTIIFVRLETSNVVTDTFPTRAQRLERARAKKTELEFVIPSPPNRYRPRPKSSPLLRGDYPLSTQTSPKGGEGTPLRARPDRRGGFTLPEPDIVQNPLPASQTGLKNIELLIYTK